MVIVMPGGVPGVTAVVARVVPAVVTVMTTVMATVMATVMTADVPAVMAGGTDSSVHGFASLGFEERGAQGTPRAGIGG